MVNLNLSTGNYSLELNFRRIQQAERKFGCSVWPPGADQAKASPRDPLYRLFAAAADLTLDQAYEAVRSDKDVALLDEAVYAALAEYQPEVMKALAMTQAGAESLNRDPLTTGKPDGPSPVSTSDSPEPTSENAPNGSGRPFIANGSRGKRRETTRLLV